MVANIEGQSNGGYEGMTDENTTNLQNFNDVEMKTSAHTKITVPSENKRKSAPHALVVRYAYKKYKSKAGTTCILENFNMTVKQGTIYSLLGASGCGKTTVLSCCVGVRQLDKGEIKVFGHHPGTKESGVPGKRVGYMPQDISLCVDFSIKEALTYYGTVYGIEKERLLKTMDFLIQFLELPHYNRRINTLSGGQQRRVSFAVALIHNPELLILDEPTVGVDPLLRESIWNHLVNLVSTGKTTVIITTHYIEEARQSNTVGFMRSGRLLTEKSPQGLLAEFKVTHLEDIVLKLSRSDSCGLAVQGGIDNDPENGSNDVLPMKQIHVKSEKSLDHDETPIVSNVRRLSHQNFGKDTNKDIIALRYCEKTPNPFHEKNTSSIEQGFTPTYDSEWVASSHRIKAVLIKNILTLLRNFPFLLIMILIPAVQVTVISFALGNEPAHLNIGVVNREINDTGICRGGKGCGMSLLSCRYLELLGNDTVLLIPYETQEEAAAAVEDGKTWGYIMFPEGFTNNVVERAMSEESASNETLLNSRIFFQLDMTNRIIGGSLKKAFYDTFDEFIDELLIECGYDSKAARRPIQFLHPIYGSEDTNFKEFMVPSLLLGVLFFFPLISSGLSYITEKRAGILERSLVAGVTKFETMIAYFIPQLAVLIAQSASGFLIMVYGFDIQIEGSMVLAISLGILVGISGMSMGFVMSLFCANEIQAVFFALGAFLPNVVLAGMMWPLEGMPDFMQYVAYVLPCTLACESLRSIVARGWGMDKLHVWLGFLSTLTWICLYWTITMVIHKLSKRRSH